MKAFSVFFLILLSPCLASAAPVTTSHVETELVSEQSSVALGKPFWVAVRLKPEPGWHIYWRNPGDAGLPPSVKWKLPKGFKAGPLQWPFPREFPSEGLMTYGYEEEVLLMAEVTQNGDSPQMEMGTVPILSRVEWLACRIECVPGEAKHEMVLPAGSEAVKDPGRQGRFEKARKKLPVSGNQIETESSKSHLWIRISSSHPFEKITFYPYASGLVEHAKPQLLKKRKGGYELKIKRANPLPAEPPSVEGILVADRPWDPEKHFALEVRSKPGKRKDILSLSIF